MNKMYCKKNEIKINEEYITDGFAIEEVSKIRRHDILFNKCVDEEITEEEKEEMFALIIELGL